MQQKRLVGLALLAALAVGCGDNGNPASPSGATGAPPTSTDANPDGSTLKVDPPTLSEPAHESTVASRQVTVAVNNGRLRHVSHADLAYRFELYREADPDHAISIVLVPQGPGVTSADIGTVDNRVAYIWRARAEMGAAFGPWSDWFRFIGPGGFSVAAVATGSLPFAVPVVCASGDGLACAVALAASSPWWAACVAGSGVNCHRFVRQVAASLAHFDPSWGLITKNPGEQQCSWDWCGSGDGSGYGEDIVAYHTGGGRWVGWDIVVAAGAPGASLSWSELHGQRAGNHWAPVPPFP
jgi:hypothetical protein